MKSFTSNLQEQIKRTKELMDELKLRTDIRIFNKPLDYVKKKFKGNSKLQQYGLYLGEIQSELAKLSGGATGSVAEPSEGAREKWEGIIDGSISVNDMEALLTEASHAAGLRYKSVEDALKISRARRGEIGETPTVKPPPGSVTIKFDAQGNIIK